MVVLRTPLYAGFGPTFANEKLRLSPIICALNAVLPGMIKRGCGKRIVKAAAIGWTARDCVGCWYNLTGPITNG